jgi:hypothetical protein
MRKKEGKNGPNPTKMCAVAPDGIQCSVANQQRQQKKNNKWNGMGGMNGWEEVVEK